MHGRTDALLQQTDELTRSGEARAAAPEYSIGQTSLPSRRLIQKPAQEPVYLFLGLKPRNRVDSGAPQERCCIPCRIGQRQDRTLAPQVFVNLRRNLLVA